MMCSARRQVFDLKVAGTFHGMRITSKEREYIRWIRTTCIRTGNPTWGPLDYKVTSSSSDAPWLYIFFEKKN